jgi:hypothetical protein
MSPEKGTEQAASVEHGDPQVSQDVARWALRLVRGEWLNAPVPVEARRFLPMLLIGIYEADKEGRRLSKREASALMGADAAATGVKYISVAEKAGLVVVDRRPPDDRRKDFVRPTSLLKGILVRELGGIHYSRTSDARTAAESSPTQSSSMQQGSLPLVDVSKPSDEPKWETFGNAMSAVANRVAKRGEEVGRAYTQLGEVMRSLQLEGVTLGDAFLTLGRRQLPSILPEGGPSRTELEESEWAMFHNALLGIRQRRRNEEPGPGYALLKSEMTAMQNGGLSLEGALRSIAKRHSQDQIKFDPRVVPAEPAAAGAKPINQRAKEPKHRRKARRA